MLGGWQTAHLCLQLLQGGGNGLRPLLLGGQTRVHCHAAAATATALAAVEDISELQETLCKAAEGQRQGQSY
jgi:hypothetical protein